MRAGEERQVLVAGGGLTGLTMAALLAWYGVDCLVVERRERPPAHPRARGVNPRAVEVLRSIGLEPAVRAASAGFAGHTLRAGVTSLAGEELFRAPLPKAADLRAITPCGWALCGQDRLEPMIRDGAERLGAEIRTGVELISFTQDGTGVRAVLAGRDGERTVHADYLVAADGAGSPVRRALGIATRGTRALNHQVSILFEADLSGVLGDRRFAICQVLNPKVKGLLVHDDTLTKGILYIEAAQAPPADRCAELVSAAIGVPGLPVRVTGTQVWELSAFVAERWRVGRVFLAGDAVHVMPPVGGFGASTGMQDAHNLAWRLAYTLRGLAGPGLLAGYERERRPVAELIVDQCRLRVTTRAGFGGTAGRPGLLDELTLTFGHRYPLSDGPTAGETAARVLTVGELAGQPGTRAPHVPIADGSVLDLFGPGFALLTGEAGGLWLEAADELAARTGVPISGHRLGDAWARRYRAAAGEAVLVRPDGIVAWRGLAPDGDHRGALARTLGAALDLPLLAALP